MSYEYLECTPSKEEIKVSIIKIKFPQIYKIYLQYSFKISLTSRYSQRGLISYYYYAIRSSHSSETVSSVIMSDFCFSKIWVQRKCIDADTMLFLVNVSFACIQKSSIE